MIPLREHPAVATGNDAELDPRSFLVRSGIEVAPGHVPFQRNAAPDSVPEPRCAGDDAVRAVRADDERRPNPRTGDARSGAVVLDRDVGDSRPVQELRAGGGSPLGEMGVEPPPLCHADQRSCAPPREATPVPDAHDEAVDDVLDDRIHVARRVAERPARETAAARLVAREARLVDEQHPRATACEVDRRR